MAMPSKMPEKELERVRQWEDQLARAAGVGDLKRAKLLLDELKYTLKLYGHESRLLQAYLRLYEGALESGQNDVAKRGFAFVRKEANKNTRLYLEATTMLAICHLREQDTFSAEPLMAEVLRNDEVIKSETKRFEFRQEVIERFDQEGALAALAACHPEVKSEAEIHQEAIAHLRNGKNERDLEEFIGTHTPQAVKDFILKVDSISKNMLPHDQRLLLPSPKQAVQNRSTGHIVFKGVRRKLYRYICDEHSEAYQAWVRGGINAVLDKGYFAGVVLAALADLKVGAGAIAVGVTALVMKAGIESFCEKHKPVSIMSLRSGS